jgi:site-specific recombinase XerD
MEAIRLRMTTALPAAAETTLDQNLPSTVLIAAKEYIEAAKSTATKAAYRKDMTHFRSWCEGMKRTALPASPETVVAYLTVHAKVHAVATLLRRLSSISQAHKAAGYEFNTKHPAVSAVLAGIKRKEGAAQVRKAALTTDIVADVLPKGDKLIDIRDRALILLGLALAGRRSEIAALTVEDVVIKRTHAEITLRSSKTDQEGRGATLAVSYTGKATCPVMALERWLEAAAITKGRLFRSVTKGGKVGESMSGRALANIVKKCACAAGLDRSQYSGHSLRAGFATSAAMHGLHLDEIMRHTRHEDAKTAQRYVQQGRLARSKITEQIGL